MAQLIFLTGNCLTFVVVDLSLLIRSLTRSNPLETSTGFLLASRESSQRWYIAWASFLFSMDWSQSSMDSAIYVLSMFTDRGNRQPGKKHRYIWGIFLPLIGCSLLLLGNSIAKIDLLGAMTKLIVITSLPYAFLTVLMSLVFIKSLFSKKSN